MEHWLSEYTARAPGYGLEQLCGRKYWKSIFGACVPDPELDRRFHVSPFQAFCLYGPEGNGKRTLALALAGDLGRAGYSFVRISAEDLRGQSETEERQNWSTFLGEIPEAAREAGGICVLVEDFAFSEKPPSFLRMLRGGLRNLREARVPCVFFIAAEEAKERGMLEKELIFCPIGLPGEGERKEFLEQSLEGIPCGQGFSYKRMAEMTEGFNYGKLDQAVSLAALFIKHQINFLFGKDPKTRTEALGQNLAVLEEKSFRQIVEHLRAENSVSPRQAVPSPQEHTAARPVKPYVNTPSDAPDFRDKEERLKSLEEDLGKGMSLLDRMDSMDPHGL